MIPIVPEDYERLPQRKKDRPYTYKCRYCGAPASWRETFAARDRRGVRVPWCICDACYREAGGNRG